MLVPMNKSTPLSDRAARYVARMPAAVSGQGGHRATFAVAVALVHGFALGEAEAWEILCAYNARCSPPWSERELRHKLASASRLTRHPKARGHLLQGGIDGRQGPAIPTIWHRAGKPSASAEIIGRGGRPLPPDSSSPEQPPPPAAPFQLVDPQALPPPPEGRKEPVEDREGCAEQKETAEGCEARRIARELLRMAADNPGLLIDERGEPTADAALYAGILRIFGGRYRRTSHQQKHP